MVDFRFSRPVSLFEIIRQKNFYLLHIKISLLCNIIISSRGAKVVQTSRIISNTKFLFLTILKMYRSNSSFILLSKQIHYFLSIYRTN
ncbi:unnamed protein product [Tenebrio molitor]|nr:unnamed protein product [Tenebrio molitor]